VREVYVKMLPDSPRAFSERQAGIEARSPSDWRQLVECCAKGTDMAAFLAEDRSGVCGFFRGDTTDPRTPPRTALVGQLWVAPHQRAMGLGRALLDAVARWAEDRRLERIALGVMESNLAVQKFY
jgi:ribosomal protein S18 acetylase RimI-like enzyme